MYQLNARFAVLALMVVFSVGAAADEDYKGHIKTFKDSKIVKEFFKNSYGYAIFPTIGKGGLAIGAAHGKGQVYKAGMLSGTASMTQITVGPQLGGQAYSQMIFFQDKRAYEEFTSGNFEFGVQASAVAITAGAQAQASTTGPSASANTGPKDVGRQKAQYRKGMAVFTQTKGGFMYEASIGGQKFKFLPKK